MANQPPELTYPLSRSKKRTTDPSIWFRSPVPPPEVSAPNPSASEPSSPPLSPSIAPRPPTPDADLYSIDFTAPPNYDARVSGAETAECIKDILSLAEEARQDHERQGSLPYLQQPRCSIEGFGPVASFPNGVRFEYDSETGTLQVLDPEIPIPTQFETCRAWELNQAHERLYALEQAFSENLTDEERRELDAFDVSEITKECFQLMYRLRVNSKIEAAPMKLETAILAVLFRLQRKLLLKRLRRQQVQEATEAAKRTEGDRKNPVRVWSEAFRRHRDSELHAQVIDPYKRGPGLRAPIVDPYKWSTLAIKSKTTQMMEEAQIQRAIEESLKIQTDNNEKGGLDFRKAFSCWLLGGCIVKVIDSG